MSNKQTTLSIDQGGGQPSIVELCRASSVSFDHKRGIVLYWKCDTCGALIKDDPHAPRPLDRPHRRRKDAIPMLVAAGEEGRA